ncbi:hypothetical protein [Lachnoclostridium sp. An118]|uniref:hypothetical protein n=1 Tax=Lachnoclostridium sp. An118 TaxID=1965547 RepID=UPI001179F7C5|nr:hypothetical protein [Lachnoclostridium sp. An118]
MKAAQKKQKEADDRAQSAIYVAKNEKRKAESEIRKVKKKADQRIEQMKATELLWDIGVGIIVLILIVMNMEEKLILFVLLICIVRIFVRGK